MLVEKELSVDIKLPWLNHLLDVDSVEELKKGLINRHPHCQLENLKEVIILGAADEGIRLAQICQENGIIIHGIFDDNPEKHALTIQGISVRATKNLIELDKSIPVIIASHRVLKPIEFVKSLGFEHASPFSVLQALYPDIFKEHMFYKNWLSDHFINRDKIAQTAFWYADKKSLEILNAMLGFRLTFDIEILKPYIHWDLYGDTELLKLNQSEVYIDGGAYDGDSIKLFIDRVGNHYEKIYAFEPDSNNFQLLKNNLGHEDKIELINKGLYSENKTLFFDDAGTRGSIIVEDAKDARNKIDVTSIDEVLKDSRVSFIKMNIEGAEIPAIHGAKNSIINHKPKMNISIYHNPSDIWQIPDEIRKINPDYQLHLRQHDGGIIEGVLYCI